MGSIQMNITNKDTETQIMKTYIRVQEHKVGNKL